MAVIEAVSAHAIEKNSIKVNLPQTGQALDVRIQNGRFVFSYARPSDPQTIHEVDFIVLRAGDEIPSDVDRHVVTGEYLGDLIHVFSRKPE